MLQMYMVQAFPMQGGLGLSEGVNYVLVEVWVALKCFQTAVQTTVKEVLRDVSLQVVCLSVPVFYSDVQFISCWLFLILFMKRHFSLVGDLRVNEQPNLAVMHTLFLREHNRISTELKKINPKWSDEKLYQESRRILIAEWQHIIYNEWLPLILGDRYMSRYGLYPLDAGYSRQYRTDFDPRITNAFASAAFRFGHSLIPRNIR